MELPLVLKTMFKLKTNEDVRSAILRRGKEIAANMKDKEIFLSDAFRKYATKLAEFILRKHRLYSLEIEYDDRKEAPVAYTDGKKIHWNVGNRIAAAPRLLERRFKANLGILFHETAHKLFIDFDFSNRTLDKIHMYGTLTGTFPPDAPYDDYLAELQKALSYECYRSAISSIFANISNILDDGHDEASMQRCFPGFIAECIRVAGESQMETAPPLDKLISSGADAYSIYCSLLLQYAKFSTYKYGSDTTDPFVEAYLTQMQEVEGIVEAAVSEDDYKKRWNYVNTLILFLWPHLRKHFPDNPPVQSGGSGNASDSSSSGSSSASGGGQNGNSPSQGGQGSLPPQPQGNATPANQGQNAMSEQLQQKLEALANAAQEAMGAAPAPVNGTGKAISPTEVQVTAPTSDQGGLAEVLKEITTKPAIESVQKELDRAQMEMIRNTNIPIVHHGIDVCFNRHMPKNQYAYDSIAKETDPIARKLAREIMQVFDELNQEYWQKGLTFGRRIDATRSYRDDCRFFEKKKLPNDYPDMAVCVLMDESGSMGSGGKVYYAQRTAILMEQFASRIGVPIMIAGHRASGQSCTVEIFTDYNTTDQKQDRYTLGSIGSGKCNRDGLALRLCCEMLAKRPEEQKLLISISDGAPNAWCYQGEAAKEDIKKVCSEYRRKGLTIYGAAIDEDKNVIQEIYGSGFLSIQDLESLPKKMVRLMRQTMLNR